MNNNLTLRKFIILQLQFLVPILPNKIQKIAQISLG